MRKVAIGRGMGARKVGRYRAAGVRHTDGVVPRTGVVVGTPGVVVGTPGMDAHRVTRYRVAVARLTDGEGEAGGQTIRVRRSSKPHRAIARHLGRTIRPRLETQLLPRHGEARRI